MGKAAADMWKVLKSGQSGSGKQGSGGISNDGARINQGRDMDERGLTGGGGAAGSRGPARSTPTERTFEASADYMPGVGEFSREVSYSDESAAVSPNMIGATTAAFGLPIVPASADGLDELTAANTFRASRILGPWLGLWNLPNNSFGRWPPAWFSRARRKESLVSDSPGPSEPFWPLQLIENATSYDMNMDLYAARVAVFPSEGGVTLDHRTLTERVRL